MVSKKVVFIIFGVLIVGFATFLLINMFKEDKSIQYLEKDYSKMEDISHESNVIKTRNQEIINECGLHPQAATPRAFTESELSAAENSLAKGIKVNDRQNDWARRGELVFQGDKYDNLEPYPISWTDVKNVLVGADEKYIYFKFEFFENLPSEVYTYNGDRINSGGAKVVKLSFGPGKNDWVQLQDGISYLDPANNSKLAEYPNLGHIALIVPTSEKDEYGDIIYEQYDCGGMVDGGAGTNFILSAYPLETLRLKLGQKVTFNLFCEFNSEKYHHSSIDYVLDTNNTKAIEGKTISWIIGSNSFEVLNIPS